MKKKDFKFKQFTITNRGDIGMPVSTDGVMLGAWAFQNAPQAVLDIGTGSGLLALMCAQRFPNTLIQAIDIDNKAYFTASNNVAQSPWHDRIEVTQQDILEHDLPHHFDAVICNPPYFNSGETAQDTSRAIARHTQTLGHNDLIRQLDSLLTPKGIAAFILPTPEGEAFIKLASTKGWGVARRCNVTTTARKPATRLLFELQRDATCTIEEHLTINADQGYSDQFIALTHQFYLKI